ncbi:HD domain-containing phosphohydrolase [Halarcobacter sp.]|uniref:response regulator n=1 Tax=Halarcobacter sp. TaxID=2321133 RepID=UPI002AABE754|nr:HD domain-containing phosphohydrolase [Halarcobacter sp.]
MVNKGFLKRLNVLYVEDELEAANKLSKFLDRLFNTVFYSSNGKEALEVFSKKRIDLVISDLNMPIIDGLEMSEKIKEINPNIPIILTTARTETPCLIKAIELNIDSYLLKPIELDTLIDKIYTIADKIEANQSRKLLEQYKDAIDESSIVIKFDTEGKINFVNNQYEKITGYKFEEVKDRFFNFNTLNDTSSSTFSKLWEKLDNVEIWEGKIFGRTSEDKKYVFNSTTIPIVDNNKKILEYLCISNNITEEEGLSEVLKAELEESKDDLTSKSYLLNEYKRCLDISSILINFDKNFKITNLNSKFLELAKKSIESFKDKTLKDILKDEQLYAEIVEDLIESKSKHKVIKIDFNEDKKKYIDFTFSPVFNENKQVIEYLAVGHDVSEIIELQHEIEKTQKDLILTLGSVGESRSKETANHVTRVALFSYMLAKEYGLSEEEATLLKLASPMHDIGKIGIPDSILKKEGKLTFEEYEIMKTHTTIGFNMFKNSHRKILKSSSIVAHEHHEKWDGTGYPRGLKGEQIHIFGRITAVADVFDALSSRRCYKQGWSLDEIKNYMYKKSGIEFEPKLVELFFRNIDKVLKIKESLKD